MVWSSKRQRAREKERETEVRGTKAGLHSLRSPTGAQSRLKRNNVRQPRRGEAEGASGTTAFWVAKPTLTDWILHQRMPLNEELASIWDTLTYDFDGYFLKVSVKCRQVVTKWHRTYTSVPAATLRYLGQGKAPNCHVCHVVITIFADWFYMHENKPTHNWRFNN